MVRGGLLRDAVLVLGAGAAVAVVSTTLATQQRVREGMIVAPRTLQTATDAADRLDRTTLLEGFDSMPFGSWLYEPTSYAALASRVPRLSVVSTYNEYGGFSYLATRPPDHPAWTPGYETVVTRFGSVRFPGRRLVRSLPPYFVEQRAHPFDTTIAAGVAADQPEHDPGGVAWVQSPGQQMGLNQEPLRLWIAAEQPQTAYLHLRLVGPRGVTAAALEGLSKLRLSHADPQTLDVCARIDGTDSTRRVALSVQPASGPLASPLRKFETAPTPAKTISVDSVAATTKRCK
jgi:hypothetical protein